jgi:hypothetical protein
MKQSCWLAILVALTLIPCAVRSQTSPANIGVGPHGLDFLIGTWTCTHPHPMAGEPRIVSMTVSRGVAPNTLFVHETGKSYEATALIVYTAKTKTWAVASAYDDGSSERETTTDTGEKQVFTGWYVDTSDKSYHVQDTFTSPSLTEVVGEGVYQTDSGVWKKSFAEICKKP